MSKKKTKPPTKPRPTKGYIVGLLCLPLLFAPAGCGDGDIDATEVAICLTTGGVMTELLLQAQCPLELSTLGLVLEFAEACGQGTPTEAEAAACIGQLATLSECPEDLPGSCTSFRQLPPEVTPDEVMYEMSVSLGMPDTVWLGD